VIKNFQGPTSSLAWRSARLFLFLNFFMEKVFSTPFAILLEFDFALNLLFVFSTPVVNPLAFVAG